VYRIPTSEPADIAHYRVRYSINRQGSTVLGLGDFIHVGDIGAWSYFLYQRQITFESGISLEAQNDTAQAQIGGSTFLGNLAKSKVFEQVKAIINGGTNITATPDDSTEQVTLAAAANSGGGIQAFTLTPGAQRAQGRTDPVPAVLGLSAVTAPATNLNNNTFTLPAGVYEFAFDIGIFAASTGTGTPPGDVNDRYDANILLTTKPADSLWRQITSPYIRPIGNSFGPKLLTCRLVAPTAGAYRFSLRLLGGSGDNEWLGVNAIQALKLGELA